MNTQEKMFKLVELWKDSKLSQKDFTAKHSMGEKTFSYWRTKYLRQA